MGDALAQLRQASVESALRGAWTDSERFGAFVFGELEQDPKHHHGAASQRQFVQRSEKVAVADAVGERCVIVMVRDEREVVAGLTRDAPESRSAVIDRHAVHPPGGLVQCRDLRPSLIRADHCLVGGICCLFEVADRECDRSDDCVAALSIERLETCCLDEQFEVADRRRDIQRSSWVLRTQ
ncbi:MAG: hypothetical protein ABJH68_15930 [Ilumatobacter sp.]|uniref:hypothetical protein n=1 Tax=Ilumatobacter sp. TaxID=1967498 RepID=UPI0032992845